MGVTCEMMETEKIWNRMGERLFTICHYFFFNVWTMEICFLYWKFIKKLKEAFNEYLGIDSSSYIGGEDRKGKFLIIFLWANKTYAT